MGRKGWDNLSEDYRKRLKSHGISRADYEAQIPLQRARGKISAQHESFFKRTRRFAETYDSGRHEQLVLHEVRMLGAREGSRYMNQVREMVRLYEAGDLTEARRLWETRDTSLPDYLYFYHGVFG